MEFKHLVGNFYLKKISVKGFISSEYTFLIKAETIKIPIAKSYLSIHNKAPHIGEIVYIKETLNIGGEITVKNGTSVISINGEMSYVAFFQLAHTFYEYTHLYDNSVLFKLEQDKHILYQNATLNNLSCYAHLEDSFFKKDIHIYREDLIGEINIVKKDLFEKKENLFKQISVYSTIPFKFFNFSKIDWDYVFVEDFPMSAPIILDHMLYLKPCILEWSPNYKKTFTEGHKDVIKGISYEFELSTPIFSIGGFLYAASLEYAPLKNISSTMYGKYRLIKKVFSIGGFEIGPIEVAMVTVDVKNNNYEIKDFKSEMFILFDYKFNKDVFVHIKSSIYKLGDFIGLKNIHIKSAKVAFSITAPVYDKEIKGYAAPLAEIFIKIDREKKNISESIYFFTTFVSYPKFIFKKAGTYREILFNKSYSFDIHKPRYPSYTFIDIGVEDWKYFPIDFNALRVDSYLIEDTKWENLMVEAPVKKVQSFSCIFNIGLMKDVLVVINKNSSLHIYNKEGKQAGSFYNNKSKITLDMSEILPHLYSFLNSSYKLSAYILYTQIKGVYSWTNSTIQKALDYMNSEQISKSTNFIKNNNIYPYGVLRICNSTSKRYQNEYMNLNNENYFSYKNTSFVIDASSLTKINKIERIQNAKICKVNDFKQVFAYLDFQSFSVENMVETNLIHGDVENKTNKIIGIFNISDFKANIINYTHSPQLELKEIITQIDVFNKPHGKIFTPNKHTDIGSNIYRGFKIIFPQNIKGEEFICPFHLTRFTNIAGINFISNFTISINSFSQEVFFVGKFDYTAPINVSSKPFPVCKSYIEIVKNDIGTLISNYDFNFTTNKGLKDVGAYQTEWSVIWGQLFIPVAADTSVTISELFELEKATLDFDIHMPINYAYVDNAVPGKIKRVADKGDGLPSISQKIMSPSIEISTKTIKPHKKECKSIFTLLDREGFTYDIEFNNKLLLGNYLISFKKEFYGGEIDVVSSMFVKNRYASDLELFSNKLIDSLEKKVKAPTNNNYDINHFKLTKKDFGNEISDKAFKTVKNKINQLETNASNIRKLDNATISEYEESHPDLHKEMNEYLNSLSTPEDSYVWKNNPARKPIDGVLFKRLKIKQKFAIQDRNKKGE